MTPEEEAAQASAAAAEAEKAAQVEGEGQDLEEKEPGGDSPEQIRARKEYRARKKAETELQRAREEKIALEARVQTLQEVATRKVEQPPVAEKKRLTGAEAWAKFDSQEWTRDQVTDYIADTRYLENRTKEKAEERAVKEILDPIEDAQKEAFEYVELDPRLKNGTHPKFPEILKNYAFYRKEDPKRTQIQAERLAMRQVLGPLAEFKENLKVTSARASGDHHMETGGGGGGDFHGKKTDKFSDIPQFTKDLWQRTNTSEKDREIEAKYYRENQDRYAKRR